MPEVLGPWILDGNSGGNALGRTQRDFAFRSWLQSLQAKILIP